MHHDEAFEDFGFEDSEPADESAGEGGGGVGLCMPLLPTPDLDMALLQNELRKEFGDDIEFEAGDEERENLLSCTVGDQHIFCMHMPAPVPHQEAEHAAENYFLWKDGPEIIAQHQSHVIVTSLGGGDVNDRVIAATRAARAVLQAGNGLGVYWGNGSVVNSTEIFLSMSEGIDRQSLPLYLFTRFQLFPGDQRGSIGLFTLGLEQFGFREIEVQNCTWQPGDMLEFVFNVAHYVITSGRAIGDGDTIGGSEEERITVRYELSVVDPQRTVMRVYLP